MQKGRLFAVMASIQQPIGVESGISPSQGARATCVQGNTPR